MTERGKPVDHSGELEALRQETLLVVADDDVGLCRLIERILVRHGYRVKTASSGDAVLRLIDGDERMLMLLDYDLQDMHADNLATELRRRGCQAPFVIMTGMGHETLAVTLMKLGASDYLVKDDRFLERLPRVMDNALLRRGTERRLASAERQLRESKARTDLALWGAGAALWDWQVAQGSVVLQNLDHEVVEYEGESLTLSVDEWLERIHPDDRQRVIEAFRRLQQSRLDTLEVDFRIPMRGGGFHWFLQRGKAVERGADGSLKRAAGTLMETTANRQLEEQLLEAQKMDAVGQLAGGVAHDFNNLLTIIIGNCQLALSRTHDEATIRRRMEQIRGAADRAAELTKQLLAFSRRQVLLPQRVSVNEAIQAFAGKAQELLGEPISIEVIKPAEPLDVYMDPTQLDRVLHHLVSNARDAMPDGGKLTLRAERLDAATCIRQFGISTEADQLVCVHLADTGCGIEPDKLPRIFEPFFTTRELDEHTGMGLSTVYGIVKQSGGHITVDSTPGKGTEFHICMPILPRQEAAPAASKPDQGGARGSQETILVVEDELLVREMACELLRGFGYEVLEAEHGAEALAVYAREQNRIDLVLTDMVMPVMSGQELASRLRLIAPALPIVFMSGYPSRRQADGENVASEAIYIQKPFSSADLESSLRRALDRT